MKKLRLLIMFTVVGMNLRAQDVQLIVPKSSIENSIKTLIDARAASFSSYSPGFGVDMYNVKLIYSGSHPLTVNLLPPNKVRIQCGIVGRANVNYLAGSFDINGEGDITLDAIISAQGSQGQITLVGTANAVIQVSGVPGFILDMINQNQFTVKLPELELGTYAYVLPTIPPGIFTTTYPSITISNDNVVLGLQTPNNFLVIDQVDENGTRISGSTIGHWETNSFLEYTVPAVFSDLPINSWQTFRASQNFQLTPYQKYNNWNELGEVENYHKFYLDGSMSRLTSNFKQPTSGIIIQNCFESTSLNIDTIKFADPWYIDYADPSFSNQARNRGMKTTGQDALQFRQRTSPFHPDYITQFQNGNDPSHSYQGVFLDQDIDVGKPFYSLQAISPRSIVLGGAIGTRNFYFQNWTANPTSSASFGSVSSLTSGITFLNSDATINANFKGQGLSGNSDGFSPASQRKLVHTNEDYLHRVYESMGHVWYEMSTDNGQSWTIMNDGHPLDSGAGENPSIGEVCIDDIRSYVVVVFQQSEGTGYNYSIQLNVFGGFITENPLSIYPKIQTASIYSSANQSVHNEATPVIALRSVIHSAGVEVVWHTNSGLLMQDGGLSLNTPPYTATFSPYQITNTTTNSINPSIATYTQNNPGHYYIVWEENNVIKYTERYGGFLNMQSISNDGYTYHTTPSLIVLDDALARICWKGTRFVSQVDLETKNDNSYWDVRTIFRGINNNHYWYFGNNVSSPNINKADNQAYYAILWNQNENSTYFADNNLSTVRQISGLGGSASALSNGSSSSFMYADIFNTSTSPHYLKTSNNIGSYYIPQKQTTYYFASGREGSISKDSAHFYFTIGDVTVDDQAINFVEIPDTIVFNSNEVLNTYLVSDIFQLTDNSSFQYSIQYGIGDSSSTAACLANLNSYVSFKLQLIDAQTSEIIGNYDEVTFDQSNIFLYNNLSYQVNTAGIGNRNVYLKLVADDNIEAGYSLAEIYAADNVLGKTALKTKNYDGLSSVTQYSLSQNYPNPFNPATTINYQLPKDGFVTLKIYDILGKEVASLVNEQRNQGRYSINFDASRLASGVYIYRLQVNDYVSSKKMLLLK